jgi:hypothetical protein
VRHHDASRLLFCLVSTALLLGALGSGGTADAGLFFAAGRRLLSSDGSSVFDDPSLQVGPVYLVVLGAGSVLGRLVGLSSDGGASLLAVWSVVVALHVLERGGGPRPLAARWGLAAHVLFGGAVSVALIAGHLEELLAVLAVAASAAVLQQGRPVLAGVIAATAVCTKLWTLLVLAALLCEPDPRARRRAVGTAVLVSAAVYLPFLPAARTQELTWRVADPSVVSLLVPVGAPVTAVGRLVQLTLAALVVVLLLRGSCWDGRVVWTLPAAVVCARLGTDPHLLPYYWCAAAVPAALLVWGTRRPLLQAAAAAAACALGLLALTGAAGRAGSVLVALVVVLLGVGLHRAARGAWDPWPTSASAMRQPSPPDRTSHGVAPGPAAGSSSTAAAPLRSERLASLE